MALRTSLVAQPHLYMGDVTGKPLDYGMVYFGQPNKDPEFYPIDIYYDESLTVAAAQPVRTKGGFLNANGDMVEVYAAETSYSVKVLDGYGRQVFYQTEMSSTSTSASINTRLPYLGAINRMQGDKNSDYISIDDFSSVTDIEVALTDKRIDMLGQTVTVASLPTKNQYYNGWFSVDGKEYRSDLAQDTQVSNENVVIGANTPKLPLDSVRGLTIIGSGSMQNVGDRGRSSTAIGKRALYNMTDGKFNIAIGLESQFYCSSTDGGNTNGTRNVAVGDNSLRFNRIGANNIAMGRNAGQCIKDSSFNVAIGSNAMSGFGSLKFKDLDYIGITTPITSNNSTAVGYNTSFYGGGSNSTALGAQAFINAKSGAANSTAIGYKALNSVGVDIGIFGGAKTTLNISATYIMTASTVSITAVGLDAVVGDYIHINFQDGIPIYESTTYRDLQIYKIKTKSGDTYTMDEPDGIAASGNVKIIAKESASAPPDTNQNTAVGFESLSGLKSGKHNIAVGGGALSGAFIGVGNIGIGDFALANLSLDSQYNIAIGYGAMRFQQSGGAKAQGDGCIAIGNDSRVSGDNQLQLGKSGVSTYAYGAVQDRSDARDKIIEGGITDEHIAFFNDIEFKRYRLDYRDDYLIANNDGTLTELEKDGSKAGKREHVGVIAQQVEQAMQAHNVDFAGLQHHAVNGGNDVYTVGYQEFIPILGEIVQRQQKQIDELKALIEK